MLSSVCIGGGLGAITGFVLTVAKDIIFDNKKQSKDLASLGIDIFGFYAVTFRNTVIGCLVGVVIATVFLK